MGACGGSKPPPYDETSRSFLNPKGDSKGENVCRILRRQNSSRFAPWRGSFVTFLARARKVKKKYITYVTPHPPPSVVPLLPLEKVDNVANISFNVDNSL